MDGDRLAARNHACRIRRDIVHRRRRHRDHVQRFGELPAVRNVDGVRSSVLSRVALGPSGIGSLPGGPDGCWAARYSLLAPMAESREASVLSAVRSVMVNVTPLTSMTRSPRNIEESLRRNVARTGWLVVVSTSAPCSTCPPYRAWHSLTVTCCWGNHANNDVSMLHWRSCVVPCVPAVVASALKAFTVSTSSRPNPEPHIEPSELRIERRDIHRPSCHWSSSDTVVSSDTARVGVVRQRQ